MSVIFDNPAGGWALLGVPVLLAIHLLQSRSRETRVSTLFLLDHLAPESRGGLRVERIRRSLPLVLRLLAVLVLAWVLSAPRFLTEDATQRVAVVLDASLSMDACREAMAKKLPERLATVSRYAMRTEWLVLTSDPRLPKVYHGDSLDAARAALAAWRPALGTHDPAPALAQAAAAVRDAGVVIYVTDHPDATKTGAATISYGEPIENTGFAGATVAEEGGALSWQALVRHYGRTPRTLNWRVRTATGDSLPTRITLAPGETMSLGGVFPAGVDRLTVVLDGDGFADDDLLPVARPMPKRIRVANLLDGADGELVARVLAGLPAVVSVADAKDADLVYARTGVAPATGVPSVVFPRGGAGETAAPGGAVLAESHPYTAEVGWQGLSVRATRGGVAGAGRQPLVWRGGVPIVASAATGSGATSLVFDFSPAESNAAKLPAFVVLLGRHLESVRERVNAPRVLNTDTHRALPVSTTGAAGALALRVDGGAATPISEREAAVFRAPDRPAFFELTRGGKPVVAGAAQFGDVREADFSACAPADTLTERERALAHRSSAPDPWRQAWLGVLIALLLAAWWTQRSR